jgi:hypothetical protein
MPQNLNQRGFFFLFMLTVLLSSLNIQAQNPDTTSKPKPTDWYRKINIRGYAQVRYNRLFETNPQLGCDQCDKSWGGNNGFFFRRIRIIFFGQIHERVYFYIQPDFASAPLSGSLNFAQIRDAYFDVGLDKKNEFRLRIGQSKVPYGFENLQSSQNRIPLDRNDGLNSAVSNERDIGIFAYWAPTKIRDRFSYLVSSGLKGSGDYGVIGGGVYNGQTANRSEANDQLHAVARVSYPFQFGKQFIEPGIQAYSGRAVVGAVSNGVQGNEGFEYLDRRVAATLVVYPQPFGFTTEVNVGTAPEYDPETNTIDQEDLSGGYVMANYLLRRKGHVMIPFVRYHFYDGGKKHELDARSYSVRELEVGIEWQPWKAFEVVAMYTMSDRRYEDAVKPQNHQTGSLLRLQLQLNF